MGAKTKKYWLMKSEPDCYSIDDLKRDKVEMWDGTRNYQVRNLMRDEMQVGDLALFYHSSCDAVGAVGVMEIVKEAYPDPTQFDPALTFSSPQQVAALKKIVKSYTSPNTKIFLIFSGKNNEKVSVGVDPKSDHPDPKSDPENPRWLCVDVKFKKKFPRTVSLSEIKADPKLKGVTVAKKGNRLSVMPITKKHFERIVAMSTT